MINPIDHTRTAEGVRALSCRAVRRGGRRYRTDARRTRRMDVVYRVGRMDVPGSGRGVARTAGAATASSMDP